MNSRAGERPPERARALGFHWLLTIGEGFMPESLWLKHDGSCLEDCSEQEYVK